MQIKSYILGETTVRQQWIHHKPVMVSALKLLTHSILDEPKALRDETTTRDQYVTLAHLSDYIYRFFFQPLISPRN